MQIPNSYHSPWEALPCFEPCLVPILPNKNHGSDPATSDQSTNKQSINHTNWWTAANARYAKGGERGKGKEAEPRAFTIRWRWTRGWPRWGERERWPAPQGQRAPLQELQMPTWPARSPRRRPVERRKSISGASGVLEWRRRRRGPHRDERRWRKRAEGDGEGKMLNSTPRLPPLGGTRVSLRDCSGTGDWIIF